MVKVGKKGFEILRTGVVSEQTLKRLASLMIVVVCTGNTCRSPMAEIMCRKMMADRLGCAVAVLSKLRPEHNVSRVMYVIGEVEGKTAVIVDDIIDTGGTLVNGVQALLDKGAKAVYAACSHPVLSDPAYERIAASGLKEVVVTDTIPLSTEAKACPRIRQISIAELLAETIMRISNESSVSSLFME